VILRAVCVISLLAISAPANELGRPFTEVTRVRDYAEHNQNWAAAQDRHGTLYVGNRGVLLSYDGVKWRSLATGGVFLRGLAIDAQDRLWLGGVNELGYLDDDGHGGRVFASLRDKLPEAERDFRDIRDVFATTHGIYFVTSDRIIRWHQDAFTVEHTGPLMMFQAGDELVTSINGEPLRIRGAAGVRDLADAPWLRTERVSFVAARPDGEWLLGTRRNGFWRLAAGQLHPFPTAADETLRKLQIEEGIALRDGTLAIITRLGGLLLLDTSGQLITYLDAENGGLPTSIVLRAWQDRDDNLWLLLNSGMVRLAWPQPVTLFDRSNGLGRGSIKAIVRHGGRLHVATNEGLFRLTGSSTESERPQTARFEPFPGVSDQVWALASVGDTLLAGTAEGVRIFNPDGTSPSFFADEKVFFCLLRSRRDPDVVYAGGMHGVRVLRRTPAGWIAAAAVPGITTEVRALVEDADGTVWACTNNDGFTRMEGLPGSTAGPPRITRYPGGAGLNREKLRGIALAVPAGPDAVFSAIGSFFSFDARAGRFQEMASSAARPVSAAAVIDGIGAGGSDHLWLRTLTDEPGAGPWKGRKIWRVPLAPGPWQPLPYLVAETIGENPVFYEEDGPAGRVLWLGGSEALVRVELPGALLKPAEFDARISVARTGGGETVPLDSARPPALPYADNALTFELAASRLDGRELQFQTRLDGRERAWTEYSPNPTVSATGLLAGDYALHVRARDNDGRTSRPATFAFRVLAPWWQAPAMRALYVLLGLGAVAGLVRWRNRALRQRNLELEQTVQARTAALTQREQQLSEARDAAESANRAKSVFLASMSHELRTPLNAILGYTQLLRAKRDLPAESHRQIEIIHQSGDHLAGMINEVLDLAKVEAGRIELQAQPFSLNRLLALLGEIFTLRAAQKNLGFALHTAPGVPDFVTGDEARLRQVLLNLLGNALKFTPAGRVELHVSAAGGQVGFAVSDTGIGIPAAEQARIFDRFYQAAGPAFSAQGAGLGLAISQRLVRLMGGVIEVESAPGRGSTFRFELALPAAASAPAPLPDRLPTGYRGPRLRVLVVDDEPVNRDLLRTLLQPLGFIVEETDDGADALARVRAQPPALILMDIRLASINGLEATRRIRALPAGGQIRIIAVTASVFPDDRSQAIAAGCDEFSEKPIQTARLIELIGGLLQLDWIRPTEPASAAAPVLPDQLPAGWSLPARVVLDDLEALVEIGDLVAFRARLAAARNDPVAAHDLLDALHTLAAQARLADLRRWLETARRRLSPS
jgi:signal transduction histidine kinase/CheY-like chemotaxis protein